MKSSGSSRLGDLERSAYGASKAGVNALTLYVATQHGRDHIRCNTMLPGLILTPEARDNLLPGLRQTLESNVLTPYVGEPDDIAYLALYLASDESKYLTRSGVSGKRRNVESPADAGAAHRVRRSLIC